MVLTRAVSVESWWVWVYERMGMVAGGGEEGHGDKEKSGAFPGAEMWS